jgi:hypothetical protein
MVYAEFGSDEVMALAREATVVLLQGRQSPLSCPSPAGDWRCRQRLLILPVEGKFRCEEMGAVRTAFMAHPPAVVHEDGG